MIGVRSTANHNNKKKIKFPTVRGSVHIPGQTPVVQTTANSKEKLDRISLVLDKDYFHNGRFEKKPIVKMELATPKISFKKFANGNIPEINCEKDKF
tara:strand:- start:141 stop:431 length:291 start_codon:yes stop_codon:yes gene_type:complete